MPGTELGVRDTTMNRVGTTSQRGAGGGEQIVKKKKASNSQPQGALKKAGLKANNEGVAGDCVWVVREGVSLRTPCITRS